MLPERSKDDDDFQGTTDELLKGCDRPEDLLGDAGLMKELKIKLMERMLGAELTAHLGFEAGKDAPPDQANRRNGTASKRLKGRDGEMPIAVPRDRDGSFEPALVKKGQTRIDGMDDKIIGLYAAGLTVRDIRAHLEDIYRSAGLARPDQSRYRQCSGRGSGMAIPGTGAHVSHCDLRCAPG